MPQLKFFEITPNVQIPRDPFLEQLNRANDHKRTVFDAHIQSGKADVQCWKVLQCHLNRPWGLTDKEVAALTGITHPSTVSARRNDINNDPKKYGGYRIMATGQLRGKSRVRKAIRIQSEDKMFKKIEVWKVTMNSKLSNLLKIEGQKNKIINKIKKDIKIKNGDLHDWEFHSVHHGWTNWYQCKLCGKYSPEDRELTDKLKKEKCSFFDNDFVPNINDLKTYCEECS